MEQFIRVTTMRVLFMMFLCSATTVGNRHLVNYGVLVEEHPPLYSTADFWTHTVVIETLPPAALQHHIYKCACPQYAKVLKKLSAMQRETIDIANRTSAEILALLADRTVMEKGPSRSQRTILPSFIRSRNKVTGRARSREFVKKLASHIKEVDRQSRKLQGEFNHGTKSFTSFMKASNNRLDVAMKNIEENHELLKEITVQIEKNISHFQTLHSWFLTILIDQFEYHMTVRSAFNNLYNGFISLDHDDLTPQLIDQEHLKTVIQNVAKSVSQQKPGWHLIHATPSYYYKHAHFVIHRSNTKILLTLRFPVSTLSQPFQLFRLASFPVPVSHLIRDGTSIVGLPDYIAVSSGRFKNSYATFSSVSIQGCDRDHNFIHCHFNIPLMHANSNHCAVALLSGDKQRIYDCCHFRYWPESIVPNILRLNPSHILLTNMSQVIINCTSGLSRVISCQFCIVYLPCSCSITSSISYIQERLADCYKLEKTISVTYPVNIILLQKYFGKDSYPSVTANSSLPEPVNVSMEALYSFQHLFRDSVGNGQNIDNHIANVVNELGRCINDTSMIALVLAIIAVGLSVILATSGCIIYVKMHSLLNALKTVSSAQHQKCWYDSSSGVTLQVAYASLPRTRSMPSVVRQSHNIPVATTEVLDSSNTFKS